MTSTYQFHVHLSQKEIKSTHENLQGHKMLSERSHHRRWYLRSGQDLRDEEDLPLTSAAEKKPSSSRVMRYTSYDWMDTLLQSTFQSLKEYHRYIIDDTVLLPLRLGSGLDLDPDHLLRPRALPKEDQEGQVSQEGPLRLVLLSHQNLR